MSFFIEKEVECNFNFDYEKVAEAVVSASLEQESFPYEAEVNLTLTDNKGIHAINKEYRQIDRPTDVLSFPMLSYETPGDFSFLSDENEDDFNPDTGEVMLGDSPKREFAFLIVHSMLHLFGYDHMEADEAAVMEEHQRKILDALGITR
mgnify:CR=1 FL=1